MHFNVYSPAMLPAGNIASEYSTTFHLEENSSMRLKFKIDPILANYVDVVAILEESLTQNNITGNYNLKNGINEINQNTNAVDFLLENPKYLSVGIFKNPGFVPYIKHAWKNINTIYDGAFLKSYEMDNFAQSLFSSVSQWALKNMVCNPGLDLTKITKITGYTKDEIKKELNISNELTALANYNGLFSNAMAELKTQDERIAYYASLQLDYWFFTNPSYFETSVELFNMCCLDESVKIKIPVSQYLDTPPAELPKELLNILIYAKHGTVTDAFVCEYYARHYDPVTKTIPELEINRLADMPIGINITNHLHLIKDEELLNAANFIWVIRSAGFFDFFKMHLNRAKKWNILGWKYMLGNFMTESRMQDILQTYAVHLGCEIGEAIEKTPNLKSAICEMKGVHLDNPGFFVDDYKRNAEKNKVFFEELMEKVWSPKRVEMLLACGVDPDDF